MAIYCYMVLIHEYDEYVIKIELNEDGPEICGTNGINLNGSNYESASIDIIYSILFGKYIFF